MISRLAGCLLLADGRPPEALQPFCPGRYVTIVPLFIILTITAVKEIVEDIKRHKADHSVNNTRVARLAQAGQLVNIARREVGVGDILLVENSRSVRIINKY